MVGSHPGIPPTGREAETNDVPRRVSKGLELHTTFLNQRFFFLIRIWPFLFSSSSTNVPHVLTCVFSHALQGAMNMFTA